MSGRFLAGASLFFCAFVLVVVPVALWTGAMVDITSGVWLSLAVDVSKGVFYRPLLSDAGIGGTRYFPLTFLLHGALIRVGFSPMAAGHTIELLSAAALIWAAYRVLGELSVPTPVARPLAPLALCSTPAMLALTSIRGDLLPAAINLFGVLFALRALKGDRSRAVWLATACFALAAFAKPTAVYAPIAIGAAFGLKKRAREALIVTAGSLAGVTVLCVAANAASDGRMLESFRACAALGIDWPTLRRAPLTAVSALVRQDPMTTLLLILTAASMTTFRLDEWSDPITCLTVGSVVMVVVVYSSAGVDFNHLLDFIVAATLFVGVRMVKWPDIRSTTASAIAVAVVLSLFAFYLDLRHAMLGDEVEGRAAAARFVRDLRLDGPIFADNGVVPSSIGERNFVLDGFLLPALRSHGLDPDTAVTEAVSAQRFGAVVLMRRDSNRLANLYGPTFPAALSEHYERVRQFDSFDVYRPRSTSAPRSVTR